mmetsp:Transcript_41440/g.74330  ORF Transcript_41440/g.74330 Transcript_41440/m.74330 type:complete len:92 (+) Transcript_41440:1238-1513(+)
MKFNLLKSANQQAYPGSGGPNMCLRVSVRCLFVSASLACQKHALSFLSTLLRQWHGKPKVCDGKNYTQELHAILSVNDKGAKKNARTYNSH